MTVLATLIVAGTLVAPILAGAAPWLRSPAALPSLRNVAPWQSRPFAAPHVGDATSLQRRPLEVPPQSARSREKKERLAEEKAKEKKQKEKEAAAARQEAAMQAVQEDLWNSGAAGLQACPGDDHAQGCTFDESHRVCAQLLDAKGKPLNWGKSGNFWDITELKDYMWDKKIRMNGGDSECLDMWLTAKLTHQVGCQNVHIRCDATDVNNVMQHYLDNDASPDDANLVRNAAQREEILLEAAECIEQKCGAAMSLASSSHDTGGSTRVEGIVAASVALPVGALVVAAVTVALRRRTNEENSKPLLD